jgi:hypothetical protein
MAEVFSEWHDVPLGSGSFGQVHRARLVSGREVAVKVQYPDARECLLQDIQTISRAAPLFKTLYPQLEFDAFVKATRDAKLRELDYVGERRFMEDLAAALSDMRDIVIPRPVEGLCSDHVIVMDFLQGTPGLAFAETASAAERSVQAERIHRASLAQVVRLPEMNYEIHLGNFVFMPDALGICDFGCRTASTVDGYPAFFTGLGLTEANDVNGFELRARTQGFFPQGVAIDAAAVLKVQREVLFRPWLGEQPFKFTRHFVKDCFDVLSKVGPQAEAMRLPARMFAHSKFEWTLWSTLAELDASADWRASIAPLRDQLHGRKKAG